MRKGWCRFRAVFVVDWQVHLFISFIFIVIFTTSLLTSFDEIDVEIGAIKCKVLEGEESILLRILLPNFPLLINVFVNSYVIAQVLRIDLQNLPLHQELIIHLMLS